MSHNRKKQMFSSNIRSLRQLTVAIRDARIIKNLTQAELAEQTGLTRPWINQFEQGKIANASITKVLALCNALDVTITISYAATNNDNSKNENTSHQSGSLQDADKTNTTHRPPTNKTLENPNSAIQQSIAAFTSALSESALQQYAAILANFSRTNPPLMPASTTDSDSSLNKSSLNKGDNNAEH